MAARVEPTTMDWIGLYALGQVGPPNQPEGGELMYVYTNGLTSSSMPFVLLANLTPGTYELRMFWNDTFLRVAQSQPFTVGAQTQPV